MRAIVTSGRPPLPQLSNAKGGQGENGPEYRERNTIGAAGGKAVGAIKAYGQLNEIDNVDLEIRPRELFTLLGPTGSGKSTVLRAIAGLISPKFTHSSVQETWSTSFKVIEPN